MERVDLPEYDWDRILKYIDNDSAFDASFLSWLNEDKVREVLYHELLLIRKSASFTLFANPTYKKSVWDSVLKKIEKQEQDERRKRRNQYLRVAAVVFPFVFISMGYWLGVRLSKDDDGYSRFFSNYSSNIEPGSKKARLILADGTAVDLSKNVMMKETDGTIIANKSDEELSYSGRKQEGNGKINALVVPKGGEYQLRLSDGTKVWLNSESTLYYPTVFTSKQRTVRLEGEAYFEVAKNKHSPFSVNVNGLSLVVLGTTFNVNASNLSKGISTTLVEGKIRMEMNGGKYYELKPKENITYNLKNETYTIDKDVNLSLFTSWKDGVFLFDNQLLGDITDRLSRWYSCDIVFTDESLRNIPFTGAAEKKKPIEYLLNLIKRVENIDYEIKNGIVFISKRDALK